ncbi:MAG: methyl-accepting chemotaxis protein [Eubacteriales bacterium]
MGESRFRISDVTLRILIGYLGVVITLTLIMVVADTNMARTQQAIEISINKYVPQMNIASTIRSIVQEQQMLTRDFTVGNKNIKQRYRELDRLFKARINEFESLETNENTLNSLKGVKREHDNFNLVANHIFKYKEAGRIGIVNTLWNNYTLAGNKMILTATKLVEESNTRVREAQANSENILITSRRIMYSIAFISIIACFTLTFITSKNITIPLTRIVKASKDIAGGDLTMRIQDNSIGEFSQLATSFNTMVDNLQVIIEKVVTSSRQIAYASEAFECHTQQSAAAYSTINESIGEVSNGAMQQAVGIAALRSSADLAMGAINNITQSIQMIDGTTTSAVDMAMQGGVSVKAAIQQMGLIEQKVDYLSLDVDSLDNDVRRISAIIDMISGFAKQTNLLALNAAIEAARAGEQGKGFAEVAKEVRKLASGSGQLVEKIRQIIAQIQRRSQEAVTAMDEGRQVVATGTVVINEAGKKLAEIIEAVHTASEQTRKVANNTAQITASSEHMIQEITENENIAEQTVKTANNMSSLIATQSQAVNELFANANNLAKMAHQLQEAVSKFKVS